ncbi:NPXTG-anchored protein [Ruminococcus albus]|uniref:LPXTG-motif cell wall anchor domain-containing protein n=1 Tax=Ruminococcus albus TaxID=1264 RepID=A0A1H7MA32_RUMAL|nr:NPXTG-anchored protein [Ruminococcus albus]SEL08024.1 hypothetical protein SAMN05216469_11138 [Ruminococcus albus]
MKAKRIFAGLSATVIAATMAMTASATKLTDKVYPSETDTDINDAYYSIGAMGFYMNNNWKWNQSDWFGIDADGKISVEYHISKVLTDTTLSDKGNLGEMGVMVCNVDKALTKAGLDETSYPLEVKVTEAKFVAEDGTETVFNDMLNITEMERDAEGDIRFHIRPAEKVNEETGAVELPANPEVAGWDEEGAFEGGTLYFSLDFGTPSAGTTDSTAESKTESKTESAADSKTESKSTTTNNGTAATSSKASDATDNTNSNTGAATGAVLGLMAVAAAGAIVAKKKH